MCGIAGRFHPQALPPAPGWRDDADRLLAHRGPDGSGHYLDDVCELVHRRLAIVDLSPAGDQPMWNEDGSVGVVFNGEIYNHAALRAELEGRGHRFRGRSDTEVLAHLYEQEGEEMLPRLAGMFALAIYDRRQRALLLARDRFGIKPLFHSETGGELVFASEIKAILALARRPAEVDRQACYDYLGLGYVPEPRTGFAGVEALPPGSFLAASPAGHRAGRFFHLRPRTTAGAGLGPAVERAGDLLLRAVDRQRLADVPVASLLSGGIDSSLVTAAYTRVGDAPPVTFNVCFPGHGFDETRLATAVSDHLKTDHRTVDLRDWRVTPDLLLELLRHFDQPFADSSLVPTYLLAKSIRDGGFKCALSGDGGDEAFGGYPCVWHAPRLDRLGKLPAWLLRGAEAAGWRLAGVTADAGRLLAKAAALARRSRGRPAVLLAGLASYLDEAEKERLVLAEARRGLSPVDRCFEGGADGNGGPPAGLETLSRRVTESFFQVRLPSDMLRKVDMMSMKAGLETRVPMLDEALVAQGVALPHGLKTDGKRGKLVLRALASEWLPRQVAEHPKHGFDIPLETMVGTEFHDMLADHLLGEGARTRGVVDPAVVGGWMARFERLGRGDRGGRGGTISRRGVAQRVLTLLSLETWLRDHGLSW